MDHSVEGYLQKQSTEVLENFVEQCIRGEYGTSYDYLIADILRILYRRKESGNANTSNPHL